MKRVTGKLGTIEIEQINPYTDIWVARWDYKPVDKFENQVSYMEETFFGKPTWDQVNSIVGDKRGEMYKEHSDGMYIAYLKYVEQGQTEKAQAQKEKWLTEIENINTLYPYPNIN